MDFWEICRSVSGGGCRAATARRPSAGGVSRRRPPGGAWAGIAALQAARLTCAFRRAPRVPFRTDEKEPKVRLRTLRRVLRNLREYLAMTRELPSLPTGTPAVGTIQVAGAPNNAHRKARQDPRRKTTPVPGVRARCARARQSRAVFRLPVGAARHAKAAVPPRTHVRFGSGDSPAEALRPRRGG